MKKNVKKSGIIRISIMRIISLTVILAFIMPVMTNAQGGKANFAGTWAVNETKSDQPAGGGGGGGMRGGMSNFVVKQEANLLSAASTRTGQDGQAISTTSNYTLDGKESINTTAGRGGGDPIKVPSVATWSPDGKSLTIVTTQTFNDQTMKTTAVWTLIDANTLSIATTRPGFNGGEATTSKRVYDKK